MMVIPTRRVGIYVRVDPTERREAVGAQLLPLRAFVAAHGWSLGGEFVDHARAADLARRAAWRALLARAHTRSLDLILLPSLDRAFGSIADAARTFARLRRWHVDLRSYAEPWLDTTSAFGDALYDMTLAYARLEARLSGEGRGRRL